MAGELRLDLTQPCPLRFDPHGQLEGFGTEGARRFLDFLPDGSAKEATLVLANDRGDRRTIKIAAATGIATIEAAEAP